MMRKFWRPSRRGAATAALVFGLVFDVAVDLVPQVSSAQSTSCIPAVSPVVQGMVSWWPGDGNADDIRGSNPGVLTGAMTFAPGMVGQAFRFSGVSNGSTTPEVLIPKTSVSTLNMGASDITIDAWVNPDFGPTSTPQNGRVIFSNYAGVPEYGLMINAQNKAYFSFRPSVPSLGGSGNETMGAAVGVTTLQQGTWYFLTGIRRGDTAYIFVNAVLEGISAQAPYLNGGVIDTRQCAFARIGATHTSSGHCTSPNSNLAEPQFRGMIDEVEVFNRALRRNQIDAIFLAQHLGKCK